MKIAVVKETLKGESRVAATPDSIKTYIGEGHTVVVTKGAGTAANLSDADFKAAGASIAATNGAAIKAADLVLAVNGADTTLISGMKKGAGLAGVMSATDHPAFVKAAASKGISTFALDYIPRISRAQSMDVLSSQSNLAGYRSVVEAGAIYGRAFPMMMTAAGTIAPAKTFIMGVGVAGLQAIATARRLGAVTTATDVRPATKEQVASLGAKFIAVENEEFKAAETAGGYAKQMSPEYQRLQAELTAAHIAKQDIVITTALIPGRAAPILVTKAMVQSMRPGSVIMDLAIERGGNVEGAKPGQIVTTPNGVHIVGHLNWPSRMASDSSSLFARNIRNFLPLLSGEKGEYAPHMDDEIITGCLLTHAGKVVHERLAVKTAPKKKAPVKKAAARKTPVKKASVKNAPVKKAPVKKAVAKKTSVKKTAPKKTPAKKPASRKKS